MTILERTKATVERFIRMMDTTNHKEVKHNILYMAYGAVELADDLLWDAHAYEQRKQLESWWEEVKPSLEDMVWGA